MISASKSTLSRNNIKILMPKVTKILQICLRRVVNFHPVTYFDCYLIVIYYLNLKANLS